MSCWHQHPWGPESKWGPLKPETVLKAENIYHKFIKPSFTGNKLAACRQALILESWHGSIRKIQQQFTVSTAAPNPSFTGCWCTWLPKAPSLGGWGVPSQGSSSAENSLEPEDSCPCTVLRNPWKMPSLTTPSCHSFSRSHWSMTGSILKTLTQSLSNWAGGGW